MSSSEPISCRARRCRGADYFAVEFDPERGES